jgi:hypothetical protein
MKCASILPLAIVFATISALGQTYTLPPRIDPAKCPLGLQVERSAGLFEYRNAKSGPADDVAPPLSEQRFDFKMTNFLPHEIVNAEITIHGFGHNGRIIGLLLTPTPNLAKTLSVALDVKGNSSASREFSFAHFSAIQTIDVNSVTYADGSTWHASSPGACSVAPSLFMRISAH